MTSLSYFVRTAVQNRICTCNSFLTLRSSIADVWDILSAKTTKQLLITIQYVHNTKLKIRSPQSAESLRFEFPENGTKVLRQLQEPAPNLDRERTLKSAQILLQEIEQHSVRPNMYEVPAMIEGKLPSQSKTDTMFPSSFRHSWNTYGNALAYHMNHVLGTGSQNIRELKCSAVGILQEKDNQCHR